MIFRGFIQHIDSIMQNKILFRPIRRRELIAGSWYSNTLVTFVISFALMSGLPKFLLSTTVSSFSHEGLLFACSLELDSLVDLGVP